MTTESQEQGRADVMQEKGEAEIRTLLGEAVYGTDDDTLESVVAALLKKHNKTIATAESCTGGLVANYLTDVPGMSQLLLEGMVTYTLESKSVFLNIPRERIQESGTVNAEIARMMAQAIRGKTGADIGLSVTGVAGPPANTSANP
jgi:nicotinamide-nucleotide amidase